MNRFTYKLHYIGVPVERPLRHKFDGSWRAGFMKFLEKDHGNRKDADLRGWVDDLLNMKQGIADTLSVTLVALPRMLGYVFNPVSFWFCRDVSGQLRAVICEVNNTFGETHTYLCRHEDGRSIQPDDRMQAVKMFHVSPFMEREGFYVFSFVFDEAHMNVTINYFNHNDQLMLHTSLKGDVAPFSTRAARKAFLSTPYLTAKVIFLIHWQALKLFWKRVTFVSKPEQLIPRVSETKDAQRRDEMLVTAMKDR